MRRVVRAWPFALAAVLAVALGGCSNGDGGNGSLTQSTDGGDTPASSSSKQSYYEIRDGAMDFSDGLAWVRYSPKDEVKIAWGCIDHEGTIRFTINRELGNVQPTAFCEGYSYLVPGVVSSTNGAADFEALGIVDVEGNLTTIELAEDEAIAAYGGGYAVRSRHEEGFDTNQWVYEVLDHDGNSIASETFDEEVFVSYCGSGVFRFKISAEEQRFYCTESDSWVDELSDDEVRFEEGSNIALIRTDALDIDPDDQVPRYELVFMTSSGKVSKFTTPAEMVDVYPGPVSDGVCVIQADVRDADYEVYPAVYSYDIDTGNLSHLATDQVDRIDFDYYGSNPIMFQDGFCTVIVQGDDGESYIETFDHAWNLVFGPEKIWRNYGAAHFSESAMVIATSEDDSTPQSTAYDSAGEAIFTVDGYLAPMSDGVFLWSENEPEYYESDRAFAAGGSSQESGDLKYYDADGSLLFEELDGTKMQELEIGWDNEA